MASTKLLTVGRAAAYLGVSAATLRTWSNRGLVPVYRTPGQQRRFSGNIGAQLGEYYNGTIKALTFSQGRYAILKQFSVEPRMSITRVDLPDSSFTTKQVGARTDYGFSPRMFASALLQYSSADQTFSSNVRFRWEYRPGSEFFVVWTDEQDTNPLDPRRGNIALRNRAFVVKMTRLFRF